MKAVVILGCITILLSACSNQNIWLRSESRSSPINDNKSKEPYMAINNEGTAIDVSKAHAIVRKNDILISMQVIRRNYQPLPHGAHIDVVLYDNVGDLLETKTKFLNSQSFHRRPNGSFLPANINVVIESEKQTIQQILINSFYGPHTNHS